MFSLFGKKKPSITFMPSGRVISVKSGTTVLQAALEKKIHLNHSCDGNLACATCHIYILSGEDDLTPPSIEEENMLESANNPQANSRLSCQVIVNQHLTVAIPAQE
ncbi:MAG: 2Fe-2S iron-sulfur cluster-binding protein [Mariprofundaceae bacterium]